MYYEARINTITDMSDNTIEEQIEALKNMGIGKGHIIGNTLWINDANPSGCGGYEAAVLLVKDGQYYALESITVPWCKDNELIGFVRSFQNVSAMKETYGLSFDNPVKVNDADTQVYFDCGCCGSGFRSTIRIQAKFDQDSGYGICPDCVERFY